VHLQLGTASSCSAAQSAIQVCLHGDRAYRATRISLRRLGAHRLLRAQAATQTMLRCPRRRLSTGSGHFLLPRLVDGGWLPDRHGDRGDDRGRSTVVACSCLPATSCTPSSGTMLDASSSPSAVTAVYSGDASYGVLSRPRAEPDGDRSADHQHVLSLSGGHDLERGHVCSGSAWRPVQRHPTGPCCPDHRRQRRRHPLRHRAHTASGGIGSSARRRPPPSTRPLRPIRHRFVRGDNTSVLPCRQAPR